MIISVFAAHEQYKTLSEELYFMPRKNSMNKKKDIKSKSLV